MGVGISETEKHESHKLDSLWEKVVMGMFSADMRLSTSHPFWHVICHFAFESWNKSALSSGLDY